MRMIIVGAAHLGECLIQLALDAGHNVIVIEQREERADYISQNYDVQVFQAGIGEEGILDEAGAQHSNALIATTDDDSINLMTMVMGLEYDIKTLVSTVNSSHRKPLFDRLNVYTLVDPEILVARHLLNLTMHPNGETVTSLSGNGMVYEVFVAEDAPAIGHTLEEIDHSKKMPKNTIVVLVRRHKKRLYDRNQTRLQTGDALLIYSETPISESDLAMFNQKQDRSQAD